MPGSMLVFLAVSSALRDPPHLFEARYACPGYGASARPYPLSEHFDFGMYELTNSPATTD